MSDFLAQLVSGIVSTGDAHGVLAIIIVVYLLRPR